MFKKKNIYITIDFLKKTALIFDINVNPPTQDDINGRVSSYPDSKELSKYTGKEEVLNVITPAGIIFSLITLILWSVTKELNFAMGVATFIALFPVLAIPIQIFDKYHEIENFISNESLDLEEISKMREVEMLDFCKSSSVCMNYKNKVVAQKRPLVNAEYYMFRGQIEKEKEEAVKKELYSSEKEQEKEVYAFYAL